MYVHTYVYWTIKTRKKMNISEVSPLCNPVGIYDAAILDSALLSVQH